MKRRMWGAVGAVRMCKYRRLQGNAPLTPPVRPIAGRETANAAHPQPLGGDSGRARPRHRTPSPSKANSPHEPLAGSLLTTTTTKPPSPLIMARFGLLFLAAAVVGGAVASPVQEQEVLFPGVPGGKKWDWKDCGMLIISRRCRSYELLSSIRNGLPPSPHQQH